MTKNRSQQRPITPGKRRRCDNCPKFYLPIKRDHRFHSPQCRADFHKFGPILDRLRDRVDRIVAEQLTEALFTFWKVFDNPSRARFKQLQPELARDYESRGDAE